MSLLSEPDRQALAERLADLPNPVRLVLFTQSIGCESCAPTRQILGELASLSDKLTLEEYNYVLEKDLAAEHGIDKVPGLALVGNAGTRLRYYGVPAGYEFMSLIDALGLVSHGDSGLTEESRALLAEVTRPVDLQVFVTPT